MSDVPLGEGWWIADDDRWYAPELHPDYHPPPAVEHHSPPVPQHHHPPPVYIAPGASLVAEGPDQQHQYQNQRPPEKPSRPGRSVQARAVYGTLLAAILAIGGFVGNGLPVESEKLTKEECEATREELADLIETNRSPQGNYVSLEVLQAFDLTDEEFPNHVVTLHGESGKADEYRIVEVKDCRSALSVGECDRYIDDAAREQAEFYDAQERARLTDKTDDSWATYFEGPPRYNVVRDDTGNVATISLGAGLPPSFFRPSAAFGVTRSSRPC